MQLRFSLLALVTLFSGACGPESLLTPDGGSDAAAPDADAALTVACVEPDTMCPSELPHPGSPCEGALACDFVEPAGDTWQVACRGGLWEITDRICESLGCSQVPPLVQYCRPEFQGTVVGGSVEVGPISGAEGFRPFEAGEAVEVVWGGQGAGMIPIRVRLTGADEVDCALVTMRASIPGEMEAVSVQRVQIHCGQSLAVYFVMPWPVECEERLFDLSFEVEVAGVGSTSTTLKFMGGGACFG